MKLSDHFSLEEFIRSEYAARRGIDMTPPPEVIATLKRLANEVLEPIRRAINAPIFITSGYRPVAVNIAIGGATRSAHIDGRAADFVAVGVPLDEAARIARQACATLPVGKLIVEFGQWAHIQIEPDGVVPRRIYLTAEAGDSGPVYRQWA